MGTLNSCLFEALTPRYVCTTDFVIVAWEAWWFWVQNPYGLWLIASGARQAEGRQPQVDGLARITGLKKKTVRINFF